MLNPIKSTTLIWTALAAMLVMNLHELYDWAAKNGSVVFNPDVYWWLVDFRTFAVVPVLCFFIGFNIEPSVGRTAILALGFSFAFDCTQMVIPGGNHWGWWVECIVVVASVLVESLWRYIRDRTPDHHDGDQRIGFKITSTSAIPPMVAKKEELK